MIFKGCCKLRLPYQIGSILQSVDFILFARAVLVIMGCLPDIMGQAQMHLRGWITGVTAEGTVCFHLFAGLTIQILSSL